MVNGLTEFRGLPESVRNGFIAIVVGWCIHLMIVFQLFPNESKIIWQNFAMGGFVFFFLIVKLKNWARTLCLICNILFVLFYTFTTLLMYASHPKVSLMTGVNTGVFLVASWFLFKKETVDYFKMIMKQEKDKKADKPT